MGSSKAIEYRNTQHRFRLLGIPVDAVTLDSATDEIVSLAKASAPATVFVREVASLIAAVDQPSLGQLHETANLIVPDGMPLVWIGHLRGVGGHIGRVSGGDLVDKLCLTSIQTGQSHYFFGGKPGIAEAMARRLAERYPGLKVAGIYSPPMRDIGPDYEFDHTAREELDAIRALNPDFIWVGISSPKQEYWMSKAAPVIGRGVFIGIGAAFDFHSGNVKRAPLWMQRSGLEWLHRLMSEPRRLWRRYLVLAPRFVLLWIQEETGRALNFRRRQNA